MYELSNFQIKNFKHKGWLRPLDTFSVQEVEFVKKEIEAISQVELIGTQKVRTFQNIHLDIKTSLSRVRWPTRVGAFWSPVPRPERPVAFFAQCQSS